MVCGFWHQWLSSVVDPEMSQARSRRRAHTDRAMGVETLECRQLLTSAPYVFNGSGSPQEDQPFPGTVANLGFDSDLDPLTYSVVTQPLHGTIVMAAAGTFVYTPDTDYNGPDSFQFVANDGTLNSLPGTFSLTITPVDEGLKLTLPSAPLSVARNSQLVRIDPAATVGDADTAIDYSKATIRTTIYTGNSVDDVKNGRVTLKVRSSGPGAGLVYVKGTKIYYNGGAAGDVVAKFTGGTKGSSLIVTFVDGATEEQVNAVLTQISIQASKKAAKGNRSITITVSADRQKTSATKVMQVT